MNTRIKMGAGRYKCSACGVKRWLSQRPAHLQRWVCSECRRHSLGALCEATKEWLDEVVENSDAADRREVMYYILGGLERDEELRRYVASKTVTGFDPYGTGTDGGGSDA